MSRPRFLADEDLRGRIIRGVRRREPALEITTVVEAGWSSAVDAQLLEFAWQQQLLLVSHDVNTMKASAERRLAVGQGLHGLFLVPQDRASRPVVDSLLLIWGASEFEEWRDQIVYLPF